MRKLLMAFVLGAALTPAFAQKLEDVQEKFVKGKYDEAKEKIDKFLADPKGQSNANAWYWKGKVYGELARLDSTNSLTYDAASESFVAFKKYQEMDKKNVMMTIDQNVGLFQLYDMYYNRGIKTYNAKDYDASFKNMKSALELEEYIAKRGYSYNGFSFPVLDTQLINLTGSSAYLAKKESEAVPYFEKLADARLSAKEYKDIYGLLAEYYIKQKNQEKADKYLALGRELFKDDDYWLSLEIGDQGKDTVKKLARYEELLKKYPTNMALALDYAVESFNYAYANDKKPADYEVRKQKTDAALKTALGIDPNSVLANYVMSQHMYNGIYDLEDAQREIKGATPADVAKRKDFTAKINAKYDELYPYSFKTYDLYSNMSNLKTDDKIKMRKVIEQLIDYHDRKKQADKVAMYKEKLKTTM